MSEAELDMHNSVSRDQSDRLCDFCNESKALLYCRADSAKLCFSCDREVHSTNPLFKKHNRSLLCNSCSSSPSSIFCCTESAVLCQNCDWEIHNSFGSIHDRRPLEGFTGCPSVTELLGFLGLQDLGKKSLDLGGGNDEEFLDMLVWETPSVVSLDDLIVANDYDHSAPAFQATGVPPLPKNRNASCGKHKEEIFFQLHKMAKKDPNYSGSLEDFVENNQPQVTAKCVKASPCLQHKEEPDSNVDWCFGGGVQDEGFPSTYFGDFSEMSHLVPDKDSDAGFQEIQAFVPADSKAFQLLPTAAARELNSQERDSALSRYKEKKKTRRYDKHVRYESRKVRAESRMRIKGRFAKKDR
ncbi:zinc finger protein CONSTANS-LIKE 13 isoform X2 [Salvia miltiorrhiza]|uniref:zinc finger protein CONSTANS-LIKE 13 isoform X2 n=1 Tax=Salvia miltiorrhiza TaxID=226208 RepID=UPI0025AC6582|nr:zinc finger protein CONSTANS-LIKE 13 isoform X2 [Salvia miltiorrhiza]